MAFQRDLRQFDPEALEAAEADEFSFAERIDAERVLQLYALTPTGLVTTAGVALLPSDPFGAWRGRSAGKFWMVSWPSSRWADWRCTGLPRTYTHDGRAPQWGTASGAGPGGRSWGAAGAGGRRRTYLGSVRADQPGHASGGAD